MCLLWADWLSAIAQLICNEAGGLPATDLARCLQLHGCMRTIDLRFCIGQAMAVMTCPLGPAT